ncbi:MAG: hypothetical protein ABSB50_15470 [Terracidiphilus sp.]|jgi:hypothetical protein
MSTPNAPGWGGPPTLGQRLDEALELIQMELRHAVAYVNDAVVPQVRKESIGAMRAAADTLRNLADRFEQQNNPAARQQYGQPPNSQNNSNTEPRS